MQLKPLKSSALAAAHYDAKTKKLTIKFHSGGTRNYLDVPEHHARELMSAKSCGGYYHAHIRERYNSHKHDARDEERDDK